MKEFYLKSGRKVQVGDIITKTIKSNNPIIGDFITSECFILTEKNLANLIKRGFITVKESEKPAMKIHMDGIYYIKKLADKHGWKLENMCNYLGTLYSISPAAAFSIVLREIAIELDKQYKDHIEDSSEIYVISMSDGKISKLPKKYIKNYRNFAAFRTLEDAQIACKIMAEPLKELFKCGK